MNKATGVILLLVVCCMQTTVFAQQKLSLNPLFLSHLKSENLQQERLAYYKAIDFTEFSDLHDAKDIIFLSVKFNDTTLFKHQIYFATDTNDFISVFLGALALNIPKYYHDALIQLKRNNLCTSRYHLLHDLALFVEGERTELNQYLQFYSTSARIQQLQKKSVFLAALLSAVIPGSGKYYLMQSNEATAMLTLNAISALPLIECVIRLGLMSTGTMLAAMVAIPIYVSSLYGTVKSKNSLLQKLNQQLKNEVFDYCYYHLHH